MLKEYIKKCEKYAIVEAILMIILAFSLIIEPIKSLENIIIIFGTILIIDGISNMINYFLSDKKSRLYSLDLINGLMTTIFGVFLIMYHTTLINVFPIILGIWVIINSLFKLQLTINFSSIISGSIALIILIILTIIFGIIIIVNPFTFAIAFTTLAGIFLLIIEMFNLISSVYVLLKIKKL